MFFLICRAQKVARKGMGRHAASVSMLTAAESQGEAVRLGGASPPNKKSRLTIF
jgi:hypothetical protein